MTSVSRRGDKEGFVRLFRWLKSEVMAWLAMFVGEDSQGRATVEIKRQAMENAASTFIDLLALARFQDGEGQGEVRGSLAQVADLLLIDRNLLRPRMRLLERAGLVERIGTAKNRDTRDEAGWRIPPQVFAWANPKRGSPGEKRTRLLKVVRGSLVRKEEGVTRSDSKRHPLGIKAVTRSETERVSVPSPAETAPEECSKNEKNAVVAVGEQPQEGPKRRRPPGMSGTHVLRGDFG